MEIALTSARILSAAATLGNSRLGRWAFVALYLYPTLRRNCAWNGPLITRFPTDQREVWLTIDDGPDPDSTPGLLDVLGEHAARASFFVIGKNVERHRALTRQILDQGHTLENHTHTHPVGTWWLLPPFAVRSEISRCTDAIRTATGRSPQFFRSPVGMNSPWVHGALGRLRNVGWSADGADGCPRPPSAVLERMIPDIQPGSILLLHDGDRARHRRITLSRLLQHLRQEGYRCILPDSHSTKI